MIDALPLSKSNLPDWLGSTSGNPDVPSSIPARGPGLKFPRKLTFLITRNVKISRVPIISDTQTHMIYLIGGLARIEASEYANIIVIVMLRVWESL